MLMPLCLTGKTFSSAVPLSKDIKPLTIGSAYLDVLPTFVNSTPYEICRPICTRYSHIGHGSCLYPSLRWLDIRIHKSGIINRIYKGIERHVSMAGRG